MIGSEEGEYLLYEPTEVYFDVLARQNHINVNPFATLAVQSRQQQFLSYTRRAPNFSVADKEAATTVAEELFAGRNHFKVL